MAAEIESVFSFEKKESHVVDGTLGLGGHAERLLSRYRDIRVTGIEWDGAARAFAENRLKPFGSRLRVLAGSYVDWAALLSGESISSVDGLLLDLGLSSFQLSDAARGFSFQGNGPLDMRMDPDHTTTTAWMLLEKASLHELADIFRQFGEEPRAMSIARHLKMLLEKGRLHNKAWEVAEHIREAAGYRKEIDPATKCFQALRIAVNQELSNVRTVLGSLPGLVSAGGRVAILSFHSLEDRMVKQAFAVAANPCVCPPRAPQCVCEKKPWARLMREIPRKASDEEIERNPRARSARLRAIEVL